MQVTAPGGMAVSLGVDATALDGVCILPNGGWVRIDQAITFTVPSNGGGGTRTDAIVAFLDPTGVANPEFSITYNSNWSNGFTGNGNQTVIALISVSVGAVSIALNNITMNPSASRFGNPAFLSSINDTFGIMVNDTQGSKLLIQPSLNGVPMPTNNVRRLILVAQATNGTQSLFTFDENGKLTIPGPISSDGGAITTDGGGNLHVNGAVYFGQQAGQYGSIYGNATFAAAVAATPPVNGTVTTYIIQAWNLTQNVNIFSIGQQVAGSKAWVDINGHLWESTAGGNPVTLSGNTVGVRIFTGTTTPANATNGDIWINA